MHLYDVFCQVQKKIDNIDLLVVSYEIQRSPQINIYFKKFPGLINVSAPEIDGQFKSLPWEKKQVVI